MSIKNLGIILLSSVLILSTAPFAFSQTTQEKAPKPPVTQKEHKDQMQKGMTMGPDEIKKAQQALKDKGMYMGEVDGKMNADTEKALRDFQTKNKLQATGKLDHETMMKLGVSMEHHEGKPAAKPKSGGKGMQSHRMQSDENVRTAQVALQEKGIDPGPIDGIMGPKTHKAIAEFQRQQNLYATGNLDPRTEIALGTITRAPANTEREIEREKPSELPPPQPEVQPIQPTPDPFEETKPVEPLSSMEDVRQLQMVLKNRGYDPGEINGLFSSQTQQAIRDFQAANNLPVTGTLDDRTQAALGITVRSGHEVAPTHPDQAYVETQTPETERMKPEQRPADTPTATTEKKQDKTYDKSAKAKNGKIDSDHRKRLENSSEVLMSLTKAEDKRIPDALLQRADAIVVIPHMIKGAFGIGGRYGKGVVSRRMPDGRWSAPAFVSIGGGSFGAQLGVSSTDLVLVFTDKGAVETIGKDTSLKLGADAAVVAGPIGRAGEAGVTQDLKSGVYAYSRSKGLFAGIALDGAVIDTDGDANRDVYGVRETHAIINNETMAMNPNVRGFVDTLNRVATRKVSKK